MKLIISKQIARIAILIVTSGSAIASTGPAHPVAMAVSAVGASESALAEQKITAALIRDLESQFPGAKISLLGQLHWDSGSAPPAIGALISTLDTRKGELKFQFADASGQQTHYGSTAFTAEMPAWVALQRVMPGETLGIRQFERRNVDVAQGLAREYRGVILPQEADLSTLEARQTILQGQFATTVAVQKVPDVRRGEIVRVKLLSGDVVLSTMGAVQEPAYVDGTVKVISTRTKRDFTGTLKAGKVVEVSL